MEKVNNITSIQNLSSVHNPLLLQMPLPLQIQQQMQRQQIHETSLSPEPLEIANGNSPNTFSNHHQKEQELVDLITCKLCKGYLIDATTLDLCMHSFCKPCAIKYIKNQPRCPECNLEIKDKKVFNRLKTDVTLQNIVYKLVPGLYEKEMARRRAFYAARPSLTRYPNEMFGDIPAAKTIKPDKMLNICLLWLKSCPSEEPIHTTYLSCRADTTMLVLKKLIIAKYGLEGPIKIYYGDKEIFFDLTTLIDVATTFNWTPEDKLLRFGFREESNQINGS